MSKIESNGNSRPQWEPFPVRALSEPLRSLVAEGAAAIGCDPSFVALPGLAACAGAIGATRVVELKPGWREPSVLWCVVVAPSGSVKSEGRKLVIKSLLQREQRQRREYEAAMREFTMLQQDYERDRKRWKGHCKDGDRPQPPEPPVLAETLINDVTVEGVTRSLQNNPRGLLLERDELAAWFGSFDRYASGRGDAQNWINMHGGGHVKVNRAGLAIPLFIARACVSVTGTIQPAILTAAITGEHRNSGLAARLLFSQPPRRQKRWTDGTLPAEVAKAFGERVTSLLELGFDEDEWGETGPLPLRLASDAQQRFIRFVNDHGAAGMEREGDELAAWSKLEGYAARLALVMQLVEKLDATTVTDDVLQRAITLARWFGNEAARFYSGAANSRESVLDERLRAWLKDHPDGATPAELARSGPRRFRNDADAAEQSMRRLVDAGGFVWQVDPSGPQGGRPTRRIVPLATEGGVERKQNVDIPEENSGLSFHASGAVDAAIPEEEWGEV